MIQSLSDILSHFKSSRKKIITIPITLNTYKEKYFPQPSTSDSYLYLF